MMRIPLTSLAPLSAALLLLGACSQSQPAPKIAPKPTPPKEAPADPRYLELPVPAPAPDWAPPSATKLDLENGLSLWHMEHGDAPLVSIHLVLPSGAFMDPEDKAGLTLMTADMLDEGAGKYSALALSDKLGELATDYSATAGVDYVLLSMNALAENLEESLSLLADIVQRPKLEKQEFERRKKHHLANALANQDDPNASNSKAISRIMFGNGYAGAPPSGTSKTLESITYADVKARAAAIARPSGAELIIAGKMDLGTAEAAVRKAFGDWKGTLSLPEPKVLPAPEGKIAYVIDFEGAAQSALAVVRRWTGDGAPTYFAEEVMNEKIGGSFTGRINMNLREDKGYTYGAFSMFQRYKKAGYFSVASNVKSETTGASVHEIMTELRNPCDARPLSEEERTDAVAGLLLGFPMKFDEVSSVGMRLVSLPIHDRPADFWTTWPAALRGVDTAQANAAAKPLCETSAYSVVVAGDSASVIPQLEKEGLKVVRLDRDGLPIKQDAPPAKETASLAKEAAPPAKETKSDTRK